MTLKVFAVSALLLSAYAAYAHTPLSAQFNSDEVNKNSKGVFSYEQCPVFPLQTGLGPGYQLFDGKTDIRGLAFNLCVLKQKSAVLSGSLLSTGVTSNYFLSMGAFAASQNNYGIQTGLITFTDALKPVEESPWRGIQIGGLNLGGSIQIGLFNAGVSVFQIGLLNYNPFSIVPFCPLVNFSFFLPERKMEKVNENDPNLKPFKTTSPEKNKAVPAVP